MKRDVDMIPDREAVERYARRLAKRDRRWRGLIGVFTHDIGALTSLAIVLGLVLLFIVAPIAAHLGLI